jgi:DivIVA domain-containing protein
LSSVAKWQERCVPTPNHPEMEPDDIEGRDFFVGMRGYDRDEVNQFLAEVASEQRALLDELDELRRQAEGAPPRDPFEGLGTSVTAVLRTAHDQAATITAEAEATVADLRQQAEEQAGRVRQEAEEEAERLRQEAGADALRIRGDAEDEVGHRRAELEAEAERLRTAAADAEGLAERILEEARRHAQEIVERAHEEAGRTLNQADEQVAAAVADAEERGRERARVTVEEAVVRLADATRRHEELRARLLETSDEVQLALMALGEPIADPRQAIDDAVREVIVLDGAEPATQDG